jgi:LemA protein
MSYGAIIGIAAAVIVVLWFIAAYNSLVRGRNGYKNAFAQIDVQLRRRYDLIPNLVNTVKGYAKHERETMEAVIAARNAAVAAAEGAGRTPGEPAAMKSLASAESGLAGALSRLLVTVERYPSLKADGNFARLQEELTATENKVAYARQAFNDAVTEYNTKRESFPVTIVSGLFGFKAAELLPEEKSEVREAPKVSF